MVNQGITYSKFTPGESDWNHTIDPQLHCQPPATEDAVRRLEKLLGRQMPGSYKQFMHLANGAMGNIGEQGYVEIWPCHLVAENRTACQFDKYLPNFIPIGSNGGGEALAIRLKGNSAVFGYVPFGDLSERSFIEIHHDFFHALRIIGEGKAFDQAGALD